MRNRCGIDQQQYSVYVDISTILTHEPSVHEYAKHKVEGHKYKLRNAVVKNTRVNVDDMLPLLKISCIRDILFLTLRYLIVPRRFERPVVNCQL